MSFWKLFFAILFTRLVADLTYLRLGFFEYKLNLFTGEYSFASLLKFFIELVIFGVLFIGTYYLLDYIPKRRMRTRYEAAERERSRKQIKHRPIRK